MDKEYIPLPYFARQIWKDNNQFKWWAKYYIDKNYPHLKAIGVEGNKIICERRR